VGSSGGERCVDDGVETAVDGVLHLHVRVHRVRQQLQQSVVGLLHSVSVNIDRKNNVHMQCQLTEKDLR
jgi:hypothetical protein